MTQHVRAHINAGESGLGQRQMHMDPTLPTRTLMWTTGWKCRAVSSMSPRQGNRGASEMERGAPARRRYRWCLWDAQSKVTSWEKDSRPRNAPYTVGARSVATVPRDGESGGGIWWGG